MRPRSRVGLVAACAALVTAACSSPAADPVPPSDSSPKGIVRLGPARQPPESTGIVQAPADPVVPASVGVPVRVQVARLHIDSRLDRLGLNGTGELRTPASFERAAWFAGGVRPGDVGPAVIVGHVDSRNGPAVFFDLRRVRVGDEIRVADAVGTDRVFTVTASRRYPKTNFGTAEVYGPTAQPQLRLITCTGDFDSAARSYRDNLVVFAQLREPRAG